MFSVANHAQIKNSANSIATPVLIIEVCDQEHFKVVSCNDLFLEVLAEDQCTVVGNVIADVFPRYLSHQLSEAAFKALSSQCSEDIEITINRFGTSRWWRCLITPIVKAPEQAKRVMVTLIEITDTKKLSKELEKASSRFKAIVTNAYDGIISIDVHEKILLANEAAEEIFGAKDLVGKDLNVLIPNKYRHKHSEYVQSFKASDVPSRPMHKRAQVVGLRSDGTEVPLEVTIAKIEVDGNVEMTAVIRDISEKNKLIEQLNRLSTIDSLTGLYNRRYLEPIFKNELIRAKRYDKSLCVLFMDIDRFKLFNDNYGHKQGDLVLEQFAKTIRNELRELDTPCRWGGEEFVILAPEISLDDANILAQRVRQAVENMQIKCCDELLKVTATIGVTSLREDDKTPGDIIDRADNLMLHGKQNGRNQVVVE